MISRVIGRMHGLSGKQSPVWRTPIADLVEILDFVALEEAHAAAP